MKRYRLFGTIGSPYALKMRALLRYRRLPFDWVPASLDWVPENLDQSPACAVASAEIAHVRPPVIPVLLFPEDNSYRNDSTMLAYELESRHPGDRSITPPDPGLGFLSHLIEDMADEWGVKIAFHYRWGHRADREFKSPIVVGELLGGGFGDDTAIAARHFADRQAGRMPLVGCTPQNQPVIEEAYRRVLAITGKLRTESAFIFGPRPVLADFGWYGQLVSSATDPTPMAIMREIAPGTFQYLQALDDASGVEAEWPDPAGALPEAAHAFLRLAGEVYLPFLTANAAAFDRGEKTFSFEAFGARFEQTTFKYQVKCLEWLRDEFARLAGESRERTETALRDTGCLDALLRQND